MKVYDVKMKYHNNGIEFEIKWPYTESMVVKTFTTENLAEKYIENNFIRFMNEVDGFCDLLIYEREVYDKVEEVASKVTPASYFWLSARLNRHFQIKEMEFIKDAGDLEEHVYTDNMDKEYSVLYKMPMNGIKTREDVISYIKKRAKEITPAF